MGAFDGTNRTITIPESPEQGKAWGWDAHETVTARVVVTMADEEWVNNQVTKMVLGTIKPRKGKKAQPLDIQSNLGATRRLWVERMLQSWTLTKDGRPVSIAGPEERARALKALPSHYVDKIYDAIMAEQPEFPDEEPRDEEDEESGDSDFFGAAIGPTAANLDEEPMQETLRGRNYLLKS